MPFNGSGTYAAPANSFNPAVGGTTISSADWNSLLSDLETALSSVVTKDGQTVITANLPMSGFKHTGVNTNSGSTSRSEYASGATLQDGAPLDAGDTAGTSTAYTATLTPAITAYADKQCFRVKFDQACGANPTINFNTVGAKKIYKNVAGTATQLVANDVYADTVAWLRYDAALDTAAGGFWLMDTPFTGGTLTNTLTMSGAAINEAKGSDIASAATTDIGAATGNYADITGTTTITALGTVQAGAVRVVQFDGVLTLTHNASSLILPGGANIVTAAGDVATFISEGSGNWRCVAYQRANGRPLYSPQVVQATYATNADLNTNFPDDDTIPLITEGDEVLSASITLADATKRVKVTVSLFGSSADPFGAAVFRDSTIVNAVGSRSVNSSSMASIGLTFVDSPASASALTYTVRAGGAANLLRLNGISTQRRYGGAAYCSLLLEEVG